MLKSRIVLFFLKKIKTFVWSNQNKFNHEKSSTYFNVAESHALAADIGSTKPHHQRYDF